MEVQFLFDNELIATLERLIQDSKHSLLLVSPFIDLDPRIKDALSEKLEDPNFELQILFGKNDSNKAKSIKEESLEFFKTFRNVEIRYNPRLHAKFYLGDYEFLMTSMNLYNYSLANNIEVGVLGKHKLKGKLLHAMKTPDRLLAKGLGIASQELLGISQEVDPIAKFITIYNRSEVIYTRSAEKQSVLASFFTKDYADPVIVVDKTSEVFNYGKKLEPKKTSTEVKHYSATQLAKRIGISAADIVEFASDLKFIDEGMITEEGEKNGLIIKEYMGKSYIAYPDSFLIKLQSKFIST